MSYYDELVLKDLALFENGDIDFEQTYEKIYHSFINTGGKISRKSELIDLLKRFQDGEISKRIFLNYFNELNSSGDYQEPQSTKKSSQQPVSSSVTSSDNGPVTVDVDTEIVVEAADKLSNIESSVESATIGIPGALAGYTEDLEQIVENSKLEITEELEEAKGAMTEIIQLVSEIDDTIVLPGKEKVGFTDLGKLAYDFRQNREPVLVDEQFFINAGYKIEGNYAIMTIDGKECKYDIKRKKFYIDGQYAFETSIYVPKGATDTSKLNVFTCFIEGGDAQKNAITRQTTNSVILKIQKFGGQKPFDDMYDETGFATKFVNKAAKTDLKTCRNIIGGDSVYGTHSLRIAGANKGLYQTVYCVNNAAIVMGENGAKGAKTKFTDLEELKNLDGLDIYFISATDDPNTYYGSEGTNGWVGKGTKYEEAYVYTGLRLVCENCPNANIHMVYDEQFADAKQQKLISLLKDLESEYSNYSYDSEYWSLFAKKGYTTHSEGKSIVSDLVYSAVTNYNENQ